MEGRTYKSCRSWRDGLEEPRWWVINNYFHFQIWALPSFTLLLNSFIVKILVSFIFFYYPNQMSFSKIVPFFIFGSRHQPLHMNYCIFLKLILNSIYNSNNTHIFLIILSSSDRQDNEEYQDLSICLHTDKMKLHQNIDCSRYNLNRNHAKIE